jgi:hypothetical protein
MQMRYESEVGESSLAFLLQNFSKLYSQNDD